MVVTVTAANLNDSLLLGAMLDDLPTLATPPVGAAGAVSHHGWCRCRRRYSPSCLGRGAVDVSGRSAQLGRPEPVARLVERFLVVT
jgi:hypothetical protein